MLGEKLELKLLGEKLKLSVVRLSEELGMLMFTGCVYDLWPLLETELSGWAKRGLSFCCCTCPLHDGPGLALANKRIGLC
jgi:hypothetical protein